MKYMFREKKQNQISTKSPRPEIQVQYLSTWMGREKKEKMTLKNHMSLRSQALKAQKFKDAQVKKTKSI